MCDQMGTSHNLSPEYSTRFEQLRSEEPYSKMKVLFEIIGLARNGDVEDAVAALPSWADHYPALTTDYDVRVREVAQACHGALVRASGDRATSALRRLLPAWLLACHDLHEPARKLALTHLESALPGSKLGDAISVCKSEILTLLLDNLWNIPDKTPSEKVNDSDETDIDIETERALSSSLRTLEFFIAKLPEGHSEWLWEKLKPFLESLTFWDLSVHESEYVRACWYSACGRVCEREGPRLNTSSIRLRFGRALVSKECGGADAHRWVAVLRLVTCVEGWEEWFEMKSLLLVERLLSSLRNGGWGEPRTMSHVILPLLAQLPADLLTKDFFTSLFDAIFTALHNHLVQGEICDTWIYILANCIRYLSIQRYDFVLDVVQCAHRAWLELIFSLPDSDVTQGMTKYSATIMTSLVEYWQKRSEERNGALFKRLIINFWIVTDSVVSKQVGQASIEAPLLFLRTFKRSSKLKGKMQRRIRRLFATLMVKE